jgi:hypothetical protein
MVSAKFGRAADTRQYECHALPHKVPKVAGGGDVPQAVNTGVACPATESFKGCREVRLFPKLKTPGAKAVMTCVLRQDPRSLLQTQVSGVSSTWGTNQHV